MMDASQNGSSELSATNPINAFHAVKRLSVDFDKVVEDLKKDKFEVFDYNLKMQKRIARVVPQFEDFHGLAQSMIRFASKQYSQLIFERGCSLLSGYRKSTSYPLWTLRRETSSGMINPSAKGGLAPKTVFS